MYQKWIDGKWSVTIQLNHSVWNIASIAGKKRATMWLAKHVIRTTHGELSAARVVAKGLWSHHAARVSAWALTSVVPSECQPSIAASSATNRLLAQLIREAVHSERAKRHRQWSWRVQWLAMPKICCHWWKFWSSRSNRTCWNWTNLSMCAVWNTITFVRVAIRDAHPYRANYSWQCPGE